MQQHDNNLGNHVIRLKTRMLNKVKNMKKIEESNTGEYVGMSVLISVFLLVLLAALFLAPFTTTVSSDVNDTFQANVTVGNAVPNITQINFNDTVPTNPNITLNADNNTNVMMCNATIMDGNGWQDISVVNATFWHAVSGSIGASDDKNNHYTNTTCSITGTGTTATAVCKVFFEHEATNGTWNCTISAKDGASSTVSNSTSTNVEQLVALWINETAIHFGSMSVGMQSSTANQTNVSNQGNVKIDIQVAGNADMTCTGSGAIGVGNISYNITGGAYDTMSANKLSTTLSSTLTAFNLVSEGLTPFVENEIASNLTYWTINIPTGVRGECNNTITISAIMSAD